MKIPRFSIKRIFLLMFFAAIIIFFLKRPIELAVNTPGFPESFANGFMITVQPLFWLAGGDVGQLNRFGPIENSDQNDFWLFCSWMAGIQFGTLMQVAATVLTILWFAEQWKAG